ncbi:MAG TPA: sulfite exporter TauE/SafE family protein, partial [Methylococcaceae bacterium]|nr:sulfite exporter TauE/SafE family protein [Methylococcaceae bacterium]
LGALAGDGLPARALKFLYALFLLYVAARLVLVRTETGRDGQGDRWRIAATGLGIGALSAVLGIGGGTLTVPYLARQGLAMKNAAAVSSACGLPIALGGAATYAWLGWPRADLPPFSFGYIYLPALFGIAACSAWTAPWGARLAHRLPAQRMKRLFAVLLALVAARFAQQGFDPAWPGEALHRIGAGVNFLTGGPQP